MKDEKIIVIDINLTRGLVALLTLALLMAAFVGYLAWGQDEAAASGSQVPLAASAGMRQYYLTKTFHHGNEPLTACAEGYHFASLWEILDPSSLKYNTDLGLTDDDSGQGPPTTVTGGGGWVRTGWESSGYYYAGYANCYTWTSGGAASGTGAFLPHDWGAGMEDIHVWATYTLDCFETNRVWCVED